MSYVAPRPRRTAGMPAPRHTVPLRLSPLPAGRVATPYPMPAHVPGDLPAPAAADGPAVRTFVVEDSALIRENLIATLEELAPVQVVGWADGEAAARRWLDQPGHGCELMIVDVFLRDGSGLGVLKAAQGQGARRVVLSNYATRDMREACLALGADRVFDKSNELDELIAYCQRLASGAPTTVPGAPD